MTERKAIVGCSNYKVSNKGEVLRVSDNYLMNVQDDGGVTLRNDKGVKQHALIHRLLALHFIPQPDDKYGVGYKDGNKNNKTLDNLEWRVLGKPPNENTHDPNKFKIHENPMRHEIRVYHYKNNKRIQKDFGYKKEGIEKGRERANKYIEEQMNK